MSKMCAVCRATFENDALTNCPICGQFLNVSFQFPLSPFRRQADVLTSPPDYQVTRTHDQSVGHPTIIYTGRPHHVRTRRHAQDGQRRVRARQAFQDVIYNENEVNPVQMHEENNDFQRESQNNVDMSQYETPASELFGNEDVLGEDIPDMFASDQNVFQNDMNDIPQNEPDERRQGVFQRIRQGNNREGVRQGLRPRRSFSAGNIPAIIVRIARIVIPLVIVAVLLFEIISNWTAIKSIILTFITFWIIAFGGLTLISRHHLNHNAIFALSTTIAVIAVLLLNCAVLSASLIITLETLLLPVFIIWIIAMTLRSFFH